MKVLEFVGGHSAAPGTYRETRSGHVVHLHTYGVLPGQCNSETYVRIPDDSESRPIHLPMVKNEQG